MEHISRHMPGLTKKEKWVNYGPLLALVCERSKKEEERYREYVEMGIGGN